jgi:hypothetical protein
MIFPRTWYLSFPFARPRTNAYDPLHALHHSNGNKSACTLDANSTIHGTGGLGESILGTASGGGLANPTGNATIHTSTIANNIVNGNGQIQTRWCFHGP